MTTFLGTAQRWWGLGEGSPSRRRYVCRGRGADTELGVVAKEWHSGKSLLVGNRQSEEVFEHSLFKDTLRGAGGRDWGAKGLGHPEVPLSFTAEFWYPTVMDISGPRYRLPPRVKVCYDQCRGQGGCLVSLKPGVGNRPHVAFSLKSITSAWKGRSSFGWKPSSQDPARPSMRTQGQHRHLRPGSCC